MGRHLTVSSGGRLNNNREMSLSVEAIQASPRDSVLIVAVYVFGFSSLLMLRRREPHLPRPYRAWWYPWSTLFALAVSVVFLFAAVIGDLRHSLFTIIVVLLSYAVARLIVRSSRPGEVN